VNDASILPQIERLLPSGWEPHSSSEVDYLYSLFVGSDDPLLNRSSHHILYGEMTQLACTLNLDEALARLAMSLKRLAALLSEEDSYLNIPE
jgi:hypothetical protein